MSVTVILAATFIALSIYYIIRTKRRYSFFSDRNIPGPKPTFFVGNLADIYANGGYSNSIKEWSDQFGDIYGYFIGRTPVFVVSNLKILKEVFIMKSEAFHSRRPFPLEDRRVTKDTHLFSATGLIWKQQRDLIVKLFNKYTNECMFSAINESVTNMMNKLNNTDNECRQGFDIYKTYRCLTMEVIWKCCFGVATDMQNNPYNEYFVRSQEVFDRQHAIYLMGLLSYYLPTLQPYFLMAHHCINNVKSRLRRLLPIVARFIDEDPSEWLKQHISELITEMTSHSNDTILHNQIGTDDMHMQQKSLLDLMRQATKEYSSSKNHNDDAAHLTLRAVIENIYMFMLAGYETTSASIAYATYALAKYPNEQNHLYDIINSNVHRDTELDADILKKLKCLDFFIRETLRMYPVAPILINRQCTQETNISTLQRIPKGAVITIDMYRIHYDPNLWGPVDPKTFYPKRFEEKREPLAWIPFGTGHRACVGRNFALTEIKITLIRLLQKYTVQLIPNTTATLDKDELITITPKKVIVQLVPRNG